MELGRRVTGFFDDVDRSYVVAQLDFELDNCPNGDQLEVDTGTSGGGGVADDTGFYIEFYN